MWRVALCSKKTRGRPLLLDFTSNSLSLVAHGNVLAWILWLVYPRQGRDMTKFMSLWTCLVRWAILCLAKSFMMLSHCNLIELIELIEVINRILGNLLRFLTKKYGQACDQLIGQVEYAYNDTINRSTSKIPFKVVYGLHPRGICELRELKSGSQGNGYVEDFSHSMKEVHEIVRKILLDNTTN